jgi:hypothetical protein
MMLLVHRFLSKNIMEALSFSKTSVLVRATRPNFPEHDIRNIVCLDVAILM